MPTNDDLGVRTADAAEEDVLLAQAKRDERAHLISERDTVASDGGTFSLQLKNPAGSGTNLNVLAITVVTQFEGDATVFDDFSSAPSGGTEALIDNLLMDTEKVNGKGIAVANYNVTFTANEAHVKSVIPSGGAKNKSIGGKFTPTSPLIEPEREIVVQTTNQSQSNRNASITVLYVEEERDA